MEEEGVEGGWGRWGVEEGEGDGDGERSVVGRGEEEGCKAVGGEGDGSWEGGRGGSSSVWELAVGRRRTGWKLLESGKLALTPEVFPKLDEVAHNWSLETDAALKPHLPAHIATGHKRLLPIHHHKLRMHNAKGPEELAPHLQIQTSQLLRRR